MRTIMLVMLSMLFLDQAVAGNGASVYSLFGIGDLRYFPNARSAGMGYTGTGLAGGAHINSCVPATWSRITRTRLEGNFLYEGFRARDVRGRIFRSNGTFNGVTLAIPVSTPHGLVFGGGFLPYSTVNYLTSTQATQQNFSYTLNDEGSGGLERGMLGLSYAPGPDLSVGASFNYLFGTITDKRTIVPSSTAYAGGQAQEDLTFRGVTFTLSGLFTGFGTLSEGLRPLSIGAFITSRGTLSAERQVFSTFTFVSEADTSEIREGTLAIPLSIGVGAAYQLTDRYVVAADYGTQDWRSAELFGKALPAVRSLSRFGIGGERAPAREAGAGWLDRLAYRIGFTYSTTYINVAGESIREWGITAGVGMPLFAENRLNLAFEYGGRGTTANGLVRDNILRVSASLNLSELWFVRYEEE